MTAATETAQQVRLTGRDRAILRAVAADPPSAWPPADQERVKEVVLDWEANR